MMNDDLVPSYIIHHSSYIIHPSSFRPTTVGATCGRPCSCKFVRIWFQWYRFGGARASTARPYGGLLFVEKALFLGGFFLRCGVFQLTEQFFLLFGQVFWGLDLDVDVVVATVFIAQIGDTLAF